VSLWGRLDGCGASSPSERLPLIAQPDGTAVLRQSYAHCSKSAAVELLTIEGSGHTWPGGPQYLPAMFIGRVSNQLDASRTIIDFFYSIPG
jgi:polyhydroxybutyrate depolymerase